MARDLGEARMTRHGTVPGPAVRARGVLGTEDHARHAVRRPPLRRDDRREQGHHWGPDGRRQMSGTGVAAHHDIDAVTFVGERRDGLGAAFGAPDPSRCAGAGVDDHARAVPRQGDGVRRRYDPQQARVPGTRQEAHGRRCVERGLDLVPAGQPPMAYVEEAAGLVDAVGAPIRPTPASRSSRAVGSGL
ncbi:hypothetical protein GCM10017771_72510 [Streptomyces capitiformicae]|uniref:Uncharacterized protein n=1 Tax=Streptomyces capitiformicae TaxID=2014920 RepID=A0A919DKB5_9ACTN|nr:hypothetical protein GCM10017771_72510 [Streptomyces capitiformicae]